MRCAPLWALVLVFGFSASAWAQFGGGGGGFGGSNMGGFGGGVVQGVPPGMGGYEATSPVPKEGITAYRTATEKAGRLQVIWTGTNAQASQKIADRLKGEETKVQFVDTPLTEVVGYLQQMHDIPILIDQAELKHNKIDPEVAITANIKSLPFSATLDLLTQEHELGWYVEGGALILTSYDEADIRLSVRIYKLNQLDAAGAAKVITKVVFPESWSEMGGHADLAVIHDRNLLVIRQNREGHEAVEALLTQLEEMK